MEDILEVGSSIGSFVHLLKIYGKNAMGLEPDFEYCSFSKDQYGFKQYNAFLENFNSSNKWDGVISFHVIEHIQDPHKFLQNIYELLDNNGTLLIECPSLDIHFSGNMNKFIWKPHIHYFTISSLYYLVSLYYDVDHIGFRNNSLYVVGKKSNSKKNEIKNIQLYKFKFLSKSMYLINSNQYIHSYFKFGLNHMVSNSINLKDIIRYINKKVCFKKYKLNESRNGNVIPLSHVSVYTLGNIGDTILSKCVRSTFNECNNSLRWNLIPVKKTVNSNLIMQINKSKMLVIGGGGLFLPDTNKNNISGWQWACGKDRLNQIKVPIIFFAVGYNYFKGQQPESLFIDNLKEFIKKSSFFGVRNSGSRKKIIELVGTQFEDKIIFQPCPTTLISKLYSLPEKKVTKNIAFNVAFDRYDKRFGKNIYLILSQIASAAKRLADNGYNIYLVNHIKKDVTFSLSLDNASVPYINVDLYGGFPRKAIEFYNNMDVVIGMRGHAQMIPFGLNCGIITLGSHDKMKWFLEDIDSLDLYIDINEGPEYLSDSIFNKFMCLYGDNYKFNETIQRLKKKQDNLYNITLSNMHEILHILNNQVD